MPDPSPFGVLFLGSKSFLKINCFKFVRLGVLTVTVLRLLTKLRMFLKQGVGVKKESAGKLKGSLGFTAKGSAIMAFCC